MRASLSLVLILLFGGRPREIDGVIDAMTDRPLAHVAPRSDDAEFLRRLSLDLLGYPPNAAQAAEFLSDPSPEKRAKKVDEFLEAPRFAEYWSRRYAEAFFGNYREPAFDVRPGLSIATRRRLLEKFIAWFREQIRDDRPWSKIVTEILTARGRSDEAPQIAYKLSLLGGSDRQEVNFAASVSRHFLGVNLHCARCHDHPFEVWRVEDVFRFGAFNTRQTVSRLENGGVEQVELRYENEGEFRTRNPVFDEGILPGRNREGLHFPEFLSQEAPREGDRTRTLAELMFKDAKRRWAQVFANRTWGWLMGRGIVEPLDDFGRKNPPISKGLLEALVGMVDAEKGSLKGLVRGICRSEAYQRSSEAVGKCSQRHYCRAEVLPLSGEQLINSVQVALRGAPGLNLDEARELTAALSMRPQVGCEVQPLPCTTLHALMFRNSEKLWAWIRESPVLKEARTGAPSDAELTERLFLAILSRRPSPTELNRFKAFLRDQGPSGVWDASWTLFNTAEFLTRH